MGAGGGGGGGGEEEEEAVGGELCGVVCNYMWRELLSTLDCDRRNPGSSLS